jgi:hypothetical protein
MINIPDQNSRVWQQSNASDLLGNIFVTKNITFDKQGYLTLSYSPRAVIDQATASFGNVVSMIYNSDYSYFTATEISPWQVETDALGDQPTLIATAGVPTTDIQTGIDYVNALLVVSQDTDVDYYDTAANTWTDTDIVLTNTSPGQHPVVLVLSLNALAIADLNTVKLYSSAAFDATPDLITTLTIPSSFYITQMIYHNQNLYVATKNLVGTKAAMFVWNGNGTAAQQAYQVDSNIIFSICAHKDEIFALLGNGALMKFNGGGFDFAAGFPIYYTDMALVDYANIGMYKDIMKSNGYVLYINFSNTQNLVNSLTCQPDGVWCYDDRVGLYHRYSNTNSKVSVQDIATASVNTTTNQITVASPAVVTGTEVYYRANGGTVLAGLADEQKYYVIKIDATHVQLASTYANAVLGTPIDLTGTGSAQQSLVFFPNIDYGAFYSVRPTAVLPIDIPLDDRQYGTDALWGSEVYRRDAISSDYGTLMTVSTGVQSRGYIITPKVYSSNVTDVYNLLTMKFSPFTSEFDKIIIKYRTTDDARDIIDKSGSDWTITWTSPTTFTVSSPFNEWANAEVGDEIEVLQNAAGGLLAHITAISEAGGTYTVTIDEAYLEYTSGDVSKAIFRNWKHWKTISYGDSNAALHYISEHIGAKGQFLQLKIELRGIQTQIIELSVDDVSYLPVKD